MGHYNNCCNSQPQQQSQVFGKLEVQKQYVNGRTFYNSGITSNGYYVPSFEYRNGKKVPLSLQDIKTAKLPSNADEHFKQARIDLDLSEPDKNGVMSRKGFTGTYTKGNSGEIIYSGGHPTNNPSISLPRQAYINGVWHKFSNTQSSSSSDVFTTNGYIKPQGTIPVYGGLYTTNGYDPNPTQSGLHSSEVLYNGRVRNEHDTFNGNVTYPHSSGHYPYNGELHNPNGTLRIHTYNRSFYRPYYYTPPHHTYYDAYPVHRSPGVISRLFGWLF